MLLQKAVIISPVISVRTCRSGSISTIRSRRGVVDGHLLGFIEEVVDVRALEERDVGAVRRGLLTDVDLRIDAEVVGNQRRRGGKEAQEQ